MNCDGCLLRQSQRVHVHFYFFFLSERATPGYNDLNRNISLQKKQTILSQKIYQFFFSVFVSIFTDFFFLFLRKKTKNLIITNLNPLLKIFCCSAKKWGEAKAPPPSQQHRPCYDEKIADIATNKTPLPVMICSHS